MRYLLYSLLTLAMWITNVANAQKAVAWSELCHGYGASLPLFVIDGMPFLPDTILNPSRPDGDIILKNGKESVTLRAANIVQMEVLKEAAAQLSHNPNRCTIIVVTRQHRKRKSRTRVLRERIESTRDTTANLLPSPSRFGTICMGSQRYNHPLYIVDGVQMRHRWCRNPLKGIKPQQIEIVVIMNGVQGATLYGPSASNGVLIVATKN